MTGLRWTHKTTEKIRRQLCSIGIRVSRSTIARLLKQLGYSLRVNHKQIARGNPEHRDRQFQYMKRLRTSFAQSGLPIVSVACVATGLVDFNPSVQRFHLERCKAYLDLVYEFEAKNLLLVQGEYIWEQQVIPPKEQWEIAVKNTRELGKQAADLGVAIALELEPFKLSLLNNVDTMVRFIDDVAHPAVRANIDVSHLVLAGVAPAELRRLKGKAIHVHLSDCDGKVHGDLPPGRGVVDFLPYLHEIKALGIDGAVSIELEYSPQPDQIVEWVREAYRETDKLMQAAGLRG